MAKRKETSEAEEGRNGIEKGSFSTSGADGDLEQEESKYRGKPERGASAESREPHRFAHKRPLCE